MQSKVRDVSVTVTRRSESLAFCVASSAQGFLDNLRMDDDTKIVRWPLPRRAREAVLTAHIMVSVGLLGDAAGFLAISLRASKLPDHHAVLELGHVLNMLSMWFGIPLSFAAIFTGITLGLGSKWGVFRYPWVTTKLGLIVSVMFVGGMFIGPAEAALLAGKGDATHPLILASAYDVIALSLATVLSVFKPGGRFRQSTSAA